MLTLFIIGLTGIVSFLCFNDPVLKQKLLLYPYDMVRNNNYYRFISSGFVHADWMHLLFNMWALYLFGGMVESRFGEYFGGMGITLYLLLYFGGMVAASSVSFMNHRENPAYRALGASGAVSAVLFVAIVFDPWMSLIIFPIPIPMPAIVLGIAYLAYSYWAAKQGRDNIGHDAHFYGALFGVLFIIAFRYETAIEFWNQLMGKF
ncbi:MAG: rhomboid family intramembrane serine protease [Chitinophagales bacterium]